MFGSDKSHARKYARNQVVKRQSFKDIAETYKETGQNMTDKEITESELQRFKVELEEKRRRELFVKVFVIALISILVLSGFVLVLG